MAERVARLIAWVLNGADRLVSRLERPPHCRACGAEVAKRGTFCDEECAMEDFRNQAW